MQKQMLDFQSPLFLVNIEIANSQQITNWGQQGNVQQSLQQLLNESIDVFEEPQSLGPFRSHYHSILLLPKTKPINVRPYRYPITRKLK